MGRLDRGAEDAGQIADALGDQEVMLHQPLDAAASRHGRYSPCAAPARAAGRRSAAPRPGRRDSADGSARSRGRPPPSRRSPPRAALSTPRSTRAGDLVHLIEILGDPVEGLQVAQAPLALLDVGLERIARIAGALVALVALGELGLDEVEAVAGGDLAPEAALQLLVELRDRPRGSATSSRLVRMVMSALARRMHSSTERVAWPTFRPRSHRR